MTGDMWLGLLTCLVMVGLTIMMAAIPWAYNVHGRLVSIETSLKATMKEKDEIEGDVRVLARRGSDTIRRVERIENRVGLSQPKMHDSRD